jgi:hypothetical protein
MSLGTVEASDARELERECSGEIGSTTPGVFLEAAVEGLMSRLGSGLRFMLADWIAEASSAAGLDAIVVAASEEERCDVTMLSSCCM